MQYSTEIENNNEHVGGVGAGGEGDVIGHAFIDYESVQIHLVLSWTTGVRIFPVFVDWE